MIDRVRDVDYPERKDLNVGKSDDISVWTRNIRHIDMSSTSAPTKEQMVFPLHELELLLTDELLLAADTEASMLGIAMPTQQAQAVTAPVPIDSLVAVGILCSVEPVLGFPPPDATVRAGGYASVQDALDHLLPRLENQWQKKQGGTK
ncbi:hypothetical protein [uncultured Maritimibacter sp.]|uniref:hypothetical protein n=2 Tax=Maritimibacter TaxID=404235 RepID=UPI0030DBABC5